MAGESRKPKRASEYETDVESGGPGLAELLAREQAYCFAPEVRQGWPFSRTDMKISADSDSQTDAALPAAPVSGLIH
jgi:hypothetical protein